MISQPLNEIFQKSISFAKKMRHEYLTIEHVFFLLLDSEEGANIIYKCGGDAEKMQEKLLTYIETNIDAFPKGVNNEPYESLALSRLIDKMIRHIKSAQKDDAKIGDLLAALYEEENTFSFKLLAEYQISKLDVLEAISHTDEDD